MKASGKMSRVAVAAAVVMLLGVTTYAAGELNLFSFLSGDRYVTMRTPGDMTELPEGMEFDHARGEKFSYGNGGRSDTVWLNYTNAEGQSLGVTITRTVASEGSPALSYTIHDIDKGSLKSYKSKNGTDYTLLSESNDDGSKTAHIANAMVGEYEYALVFVGFDEAEQHSIIDNVDLTPYQK